MVRGLDRQPKCELGRLPEPRTLKFTREGHALNIQHLSLLKWLHRRPLGVASQAASVTSKRFGSRLQSDCRGGKEKQSRADNVESFRRGPSSLCQGK